MWRDVDDRPGARGEPHRALSEDVNPFPTVLERAQRGDRDAFEHLVGMLERPLLSFLRSHGSSSADDLANEVLLQVFTSIGGFSGGEADFRAWVFTIARHRAIDEHRKQTRRPTQLVDPRDLVDHQAREQEDRLDELERAERLLASLTDEQREVILLRIVAGLSVDETAAVVGRRPGAVRALQHRALAQLRKRLGKERADV